MKKLLTFLIALTFLFLFVGSPVVFANNDLIYGQGAYLNKDYKTAYKLFFPLAEQGDASAQNNLGVMYKNGQGVPQDNKEASKWFRFSAEQGNAFAQQNLGLMYFEGQGVPQDYVLAHMWWNLAGSNGNKNAVENRNIVEKKMSKQQIEKAQEMARNWKPKKK